MAPLIGNIVELPRASRNIIQEEQPEIWTLIQILTVARNADVFSF